MIIDCPRKDNHWISTIQVDLNHSFIRRDKWVGQNLSQGIGGVSMYLPLKPGFSNLFGTVDY